MRLNFHIYIDLNYFGPRGLNKLQSGSRGVALFFSSFTGIWFNWYRGAPQKRDGKNSLGHLAEDLTCSCSSGEKETERGRDGEREKSLLSHTLQVGLFKAGFLRCPYRCVHFQHFARQ